VLTEDEFDDTPNVASRPLPHSSSRKEDRRERFRSRASCGRAHVHVSRKLDVNEPTTGLANTLHDDADLASSRLLCPRRLATSTHYHAFVIPTFEAGRLAGLGLDVPASTDATQSAWGDGQVEFPYYYRWRFRTASLGDFEYLVRLLVAQPCDKRVGSRHRRFTPRTFPRSRHPSSSAARLLGGALRPVRDAARRRPEVVTTYDEWDQHCRHIRIRSSRRCRTGQSRRRPHDRERTDANRSRRDVAAHGRWHAPTTAARGVAGAAVANLTNCARAQLDPAWRRGRDRHARRPDQPGEVGDLRSAMTSSRQIARSCSANRARGRARSTRTFATGSCAPSDGSWVHRRVLTSGDGAPRT
jgi:hypothetical protein